MSPDQQEMIWLAITALTRPGRGGRGSRLVMGPATTRQRRLFSTSSCHSTTTSLFPYQNTVTSYSPCPDGSAYRAYCSPPPALSHDQPPRFQRKKQKCNMLRDTAFCHFIVQIVSVHCQTCQTRTPCDRTVSIPIHRLDYLVACDRSA
jgi:hypothetical protein